MSYFPIENQTMQICIHIFWTVSQPQTKDSNDKPGDVSSNKTSQLANREVTVKNRETRIDSSIDSHLFLHVHFMYCLRCCCCCSCAKAVTATHAQRRERCDWPTESATNDCWEKTLLQQENLNKTHKKQVGKMRNKSGTGAKIVKSDFLIALIVLRQLTGELG